MLQTHRLTYFLLGLLFAYITVWICNSVKEPEKSEPSLIPDYGAEVNSVAATLYNQVRVFCLIMTTANNTNKMLSVNNTWARRCTEYVFVTPDTDFLNGTNVPYVDFGIVEGREHLWEKTSRSFQWIYENNVDEFDYFLKADDDTYVIMENLRLMLLPHSPDEKLYFGCHLKVKKHEYMSGGAGYVLSRGAVKELNENNISCLDSKAKLEDMMMGNCMKKLGIKFVDSTDSQGRHRMLPLTPGRYFNAEKEIPKWFLGYLVKPYHHGKDCCSNYYISFHYVDHRMMNLMEALLYRIRPVGSLDSEWISLYGQSKGLGHDVKHALMQLSIARNPKISPQAVKKQ